MRGLEGHRLILNVKLPHFIHKPKLKELKMEGLVILVIMVGIWAAFGLWAKSVMTPKGYGPVASFFVGAIGGIFGILIAYLMPKKTD